MTTFPRCFRCVPELLDLEADAIASPYPFADKSIDDFPFLEFLETEACAAPLALIALKCILRLNTYLC